MKKNPTLWGQEKIKLDRHGRIVIPISIVKELGGVEELLCVLDGPDGEQYINVYPGRKKIRKLPPEKMKDVWPVTICKSKPRITFPEHIRKNLFPNCDTVVIEGWKDYFKIIPLRR